MTNSKENQERIKAIAHELKFWKSFVQTERFIKGWAMNGKTPEFNQKAYDIMWHALGGVDRPRILDVGSGVVSLLHGSMERAELVAADPLGELYESIFDYNAFGIKPCVPVRGEDLTFENEFDFVHMSNAIDHSEHPWKVLNRLINACKFGGHVMIQGFENEGNFELYQGMHKWDVTLQKGELFCAAEHGPVNELTYPYRNAIETVFAEKEPVQSGRGFKTWYIWMGKVKSNASTY